MSNQPRNSFGEWIADESMKATQMATLEVERRSAPPYEHLLGIVRDADIAADYEVSHQAVQQQRTKRGIVDFMEGRRRAAVPFLGTMTDVDLAAMMDVSAGTVRNWRIAADIPGYQTHAEKARAAKVAEFRARHVEQANEQRLRAGVTLHWSTMPGLPWCRGRDGALPWTADSLVTGIREAEDLVDCPGCRAGFLSWLERSERDVGRHVREHSQARGYPCGDVEPRASRSGFVRAAFSGFSRIT